jgi:predicted PurR-regulated permease PerM
MTNPGTVVRDLPRTILAVLFILALLITSLWVLRPFLAAIVWAATLVIATWPLLLSLEKRLGGRRGWAAAVMTAVFALAFLGPVTFGIITAIGSAGDLSAWASELPNRPPPVMPAWLSGLPVVGPQLQAKYDGLVAARESGGPSLLAEHARAIAQWFLGQLGSLLGMMVQLLVTLVIAAVLYVSGEKVAAGVVRFARRLGGDDGEEAARLAALATRGVALGVVVTALIQAVLAGGGMAIAGAPYPGLLAVAAFVCCLAQIGPVPAMLIAVGALYSRGAHVAATALLVWMVVVGTFDNILRPILIKRSVDLPFALIFSGVIGGLIAFGVLGLFIGPVVLAVTSTLLERWMAEGERAAGGATG